MSYAGENGAFSFRDGYCELLPGRSGYSEAQYLGRAMTAAFPEVRRFCACSGSFRSSGILHALCSGITEGGKDVYICEDTDLPSMRYSLPLLSADIGIYVTSEPGLKLRFYSISRLPLQTGELSRLSRTKPPENAGKPGKMLSCTTFKDIYICNIADTLRTRTALPAGISCGDRAVRSLWLELFSGEDDSLVYQVSGCGSRVNAYSSAYGVIPHEKLILAYSALCPEKPVYLPESVHYAAEDIIPDIRRFPDDEPPDTVPRYLTDPLFMCSQLTDRLPEFMEILRRMPALAAVRREVAVSGSKALPGDIRCRDGRVLVTRSGRSRLTVTAQSHSIEAASELCGEWTDRLRKKNPDP